MHAVSLNAWNHQSHLVVQLLCENNDLSLGRDVVVTALREFRPKRERCLLCLRNIYDLYILANKLDIVGFQLCCEESLMALWNY